MPQAIPLLASAVAKSFLTTALGSTLAASFAGKLIIGIGSALVGSLASSIVGGRDRSQAPRVQKDAGLLLNQTASDAPIPVIYGLRRVGGTRVFVGSAGDDNSTLYIVLAIGEGEIEQVDTVYYSTAEFVTDMSAKAENVPSTGFGIAVKAVIIWRSGADSPDVLNPFLGNLLASIGWTSAHQLKGVAHIIASLNFDPDVWVGGVPTINADIKGVKVYDPRTSLTAWSDNPALCIRDYLTNARYGRGIPESQIDDDSIIEAANYCDELVTKGGVSAKRYTCNGAVQTDLESLDIIQQLLSSCRGMLVYTGGVYRLKIDKPEVASFTFDEDNIVGGWAITLGDTSTMFNQVRAVFFNKEREFQPDIATVKSDTLKALDNDRLLDVELSLPFTSDSATARQIATINLNQSRQQTAVEFTATIAAFQVEVGDVVYVKHPTPGWDSMNGGLGKLFRVLRMDIQNTDEVKVSAVEYDETAYDFGTISVEDTAPDTTLPNPTDISPPSGLEVTESIFETVGSAGVQTLAVLSWQAPSDVFVTGYESQLQPVGGAYGPITVTPSTQAEFRNITPGVYNFRVRSVNNFGVHSAFSELSNVTIVGLSEKPADMTGLTVVGLSDQAHLAWLQSTDLDVRVGGTVQFRHSDLTSGATWESSLPIGDQLPGIATNTVLPLLPGTYLGKFIDSTGNESNIEATFVIPLAPTMIQFNAVETSTQHPAFTGTKTDMVAIDNVLKLDGATLIDSWGDIDDLLAIDEGDGVELSGRYDFDSYIDLGAVFTSRVTASLSSSAYITSDLIDNRGNVDDWIDVDNTPAGSSVELFVRSTNDDPTGSPTWTDWARFTVADYTARAFEFFVTVSVQSQYHQIEIDQLSVSVDMPDRVESAIGVLSGAATKSVTYTNSFHSQPALMLTPSNLQTGDFFEITNETSSGFDVTFKNSGGTAVSRSFSYSAKGY